MKLRLLPVLFLALLTVPTGGAAYAQVNDYLEITRVDVDSFPKVKVYVRAFCLGVQQPFIQPTTVRIIDGDTMRTVQVACPPESVPISVGLCLDRSSSVSGTTIQIIRRGAIKFVSLMQDRQHGNDEALIVSFNENIWYDQTMTSFKQDLYDAIFNIIEHGNTGMYDALMFTLQEVANNASNPVRAVILLTDGADNTSTTTMRDVIDFSRLVNIPVYTIGLLYRTLPEDLARIREISDSTGGVFIPVEDPFEIENAFKALNSIIPDGQNDCTLDFLSGCADGTVHKIVVEAEACNRTLVDTAYVRVPLDPNIPKLRIYMDTTFVYSGEDALVPVMISSGTQPVRIQNLDIELQQQQALAFQGAITGGHVAEHLSLAVGNELNELILRMYGDYVFSGTDTLLLLRFRAQDLTAGDTLVRLPYLFVSKQTSECMQLVADPGYVKIIRRTALFIDCESDTLRIEWDNENSRYVPEEFIYRATVRNPSPLPMQNIRVHLQLPPGMELTQGSPSVAVGNGTLAGGAQGQVAFHLRVLPSDTARVFDLCAIVSADSAQVAQCCTHLEIARAKPLLRSWCAMPQEIRWSDSLEAYVPSTIPVTIGVTNHGALMAKDVEAWIHVPSGFEIDSVPPTLTHIQPNILQQNDTGSVTWFVRPRERQTADSMEFCIKSAAGGDTTVCCQKVYISASPIRAGIVCSESKVLSFSDETKEFNPQNFLVNISVKNNSSIPMERARARITLPPFVRVAQGDSYQKDLPGGGILKAGESVNVLWSLEASGEPIDNAQACVEIIADNYNGGDCCIPIDVQRNVKLPRLTCSLDGPDTIRFVQTAYQPNPFVLNLTVKNAGDSKAKNVFAALLQGEDLSIHSSDQSLKKIADSLDVNEEVFATFTIQVLNRSLQRADTVRVSVYSDNGGAVVCEKIIIIEAVRGPKIELQCFGPDTLTFDDATNSYVPSPFTLRLVATNTGTADADSVVAEFLAGPNIELIAGEKAAKMLTPQRLAPTQSGEATWQVNAVPRTVGRTDTVYLQVKVKGALLEEIVPCPVPIYIPPVRKAELHAACEASAEFTVVDGEYRPDPLQLRLRVDNLGDAFAYDVTATATLPSRLYFGSSSQAEYSIPLLDPLTGSTEFIWNVRPETRTVGDTVEVCFRISARFQNDIVCCVKLYIPPITEPTGDISVICTAIDTLWGDNETWTYPQVSVNAVVTNISTVLVDSVLAVIILPNGLQLAPGQSEEKRLLALSPASSVNITWQLDVLADTSTVPKVRQIRIQFVANGKVKYCDLTIVVMPLNRPGEQSYSLACASPDSIFYIDAQTGLQPSPFQVSVTITNTGTSSLQGYTAAIDFPAQIALANGEIPVIQSQDVIPPGGKRTVTWRCVPTIRPVTNEVEFRFTVSVTGLPDAVCLSPTVIEGAKTVLTISIPNGNVVGYGMTTLVPVNLSNPAMASFTSFDIGLEFDPTVVQLQGISRSATLTSLWNDASLTPTGPGTYRLSGTADVPIAASGVLLNLTFAGIVDDGGYGKFDVVTSELDLTDATLSDPYAVHLVDGDITSSGSCVMPLNASEFFVLEQNRPNPFNPVTTIAYRLPASFREMPTELVVYDTYGRAVRRFDEGLRDGGRYTVQMDASGLESGVYFYRLTSGPYTRIRKMVYMK